MGLTEEQTIEQLLAQSQAAIDRARRTGRIMLALVVLAVVLAVVALYF